MDIDILCKVVDNFGDIGVAYRLARALGELPDPPRLRLVVDDLAAFAALEPAIDPAAGRQSIGALEVFPWGGARRAESVAAFRARRPRVVIECFACGRPDWLEELLFDAPDRGDCLILDLEHLTAEAFAADFHRLPSLTRSPLVRKAMFFPGFAPGTGGLLLDRGFSRARDRAREAGAATGDRAAGGRAALRREFLAAAGFAGAGAAAASDAAAAAAPPEARFWISLFGYERDYGRIVEDLAAFGRTTPILALAAAGKSQACFLRAWREAGEPFPALALPFLPQGAWDALLAACDFSIVRGEDSWSRASLSGRPFLWQAYPQEGRHHLVKVEAFLDRLRPHFPGAVPATADAAPAVFAALAALYRAFNDRDGDRADLRGEETLLPVLRSHSALLQGFSAFSVSLEANADLAVNLVTFLREIV